MKEYIRDNKRVRKCPSNISKMNIFEWIYYDFRDWNELSNMKYYFLESIKYICLGCINLLSVLLFPLSILINAILSIYRAKKEVKKRYKELKDVAED